MPLEMKRTVELPEGRSSGKIIRAAIEPSTNKRTGETYNYLNLDVLVDTQKWTPEQNMRAEGYSGKSKVSLSANLSKISDLGRLLTRLNIPLPAVGQVFDEKTLEGIAITFDMKREGNFVNIVTDSISIAK